MRRVQGKNDQVPCDYYDNEADCSSEVDRCQWRFDFCEECPSGDCNVREGA